MECGKWVSIPTTILYHTFETTFFDPIMFGMTVGVGGVATWTYYNTDLAARSGAASRQALRAEHYFTLALREISKKMNMYYLLQ